MTEQGEMDWSETLKVVTVSLAFVVQLAALFYWGGIIRSEVSLMGDRMDRHIERANKVNDRQDRQIRELQIRVGQGTYGTRGDTILFVPSGAYRAVEGS